MTARFLSKILLDRDILVDCTSQTSGDISGENVSLPSLSGNTSDGTGVTRTTVISIVIRQITAKVTRQQQTQTQKVTNITSDSRQKQLREKEISLRTDRERYRDQDLCSLIESITKYKQDVFCLLN